MRSVADVLGRPAFDFLIREDGGITAVFVFSLRLLCPVETDDFQRPV